MRTLDFVEQLFTALHNGNDREWLKIKKKGRTVNEAVNKLGAVNQWNVLILIDRLDDSWDGSDRAVMMLTALMHSCVEIWSASKCVRPMVFLRENIFERVRQVDREFSRLETSVVSLDWTRELLLELVERRLTQHLIAKNKRRGFIVDYVGLTAHLKEALSVYAAADRKDLADGLKGIASEIPAMEDRYRRLVQLFQDLGVAEIEPWVRHQITDPDRLYAVQEQAVEGMKDLKQRANFEVYLQKFLQSVDIVLPNTAATPFKVPAKRFAYLLAKMKDRYKDDTLSISGAGEKVRAIINAHLVSLGINPKIKPVELLSPRFVTELDKNKTARAKASEMEHAIRKHCKVHFAEDPVLYRKLSEKLESLIQKYKDNWDELYRHLFELRTEAEAGRTGEQDPLAGPFADLIGQIAFGTGGVPPEHRDGVAALVGRVLERLKATVGIINFWGNAPEVSKLKGELSDLLLFTGVDRIADKSDKIVTEITALAKVRTPDILA